MAPYDKIIITIVERDTWEASLVLIALVLLLVHRTRNNTELVIFPGIAFYYDNNYRN